MARATGAKEKIERAAIELFAAAGVDGVSIADIAAAAGVSEGALYRHYSGKDTLAWELFSTAYLRIALEVDVIRAECMGFTPRVAQMMAYFCALYDDDPALFRFMLLSQHGLLKRIPVGTRTPVDAIIDVIADAVAAGDIVKVSPELGAAAILGTLLQTATFIAYGRLMGPLSGYVTSLTNAAIGAVRALG